MKSQIEPSFVKNDLRNSNFRTKDIKIVDITLPIFSNSKVCDQEFI